MSISDNDYDSYLQNGKALGRLGVVRADHSVFEEPARGAQTADFLSGLRDPATSFFHLESSTSKSTTVKILNNCVHVLLKELLAKS